jgi:uncharacterized protein YdbL (DUF1318 family)
MRKIILGLLVSVLVALVGCVTINVYFPEAAAKKAADQFIDTVLDGATPATPAKSSTEPAPSSRPPSGKPLAMLMNLLLPAAYAADTPDLRIQTATSEAIRERMRQRFQNSLSGALGSGAVGLTQNGLVALRDASQLPLEQRAVLTAAVADENRDRDALYREVARANGHPEWEAQIRATFARGWIERAPAGWYYQNPAGGWQQK